MAEVNYHTDYDNLKIHKKPEVDTKKETEKYLLKKRSVYASNIKTTHMKLPLINKKKTLNTQQSMPMLGELHQENELYKQNVLNIDYNKDSVGLHGIRSIDKYIRNDITNKYKLMNLNQPLPIRDHKDEYKKQLKRNLSSNIEVNKPELSNLTKKQIQVMESLGIK